MRCYNINMTEGDPAHNECEYFAVIGVYEDGINTKGCFVTDNTLENLLELCKKEILRYETEV